MHINTSILESRCAEKSLLISNILLFYANTKHENRYERQRITMGKDKKRDNLNETEQSKKFYNDQLGENAHEEYAKDYDNLGSEIGKPKKENK